MTTSSRFPNRCDPIEARRRFRMRFIVEKDRFALANETRMLIAIRYSAYIIGKSW